MLLATAASSLFIFSNRRLAEIFPHRWRNLWNDWELRVAVIISLFMQTILILLGNRRKYKSKDWLVVILWLVYLSADWIVNVSLGVLSNMESTDKNGSLDPKYMIMAFWAPFLLHHLGSPHTITAYSPEDSELWMRQLVGVLVKFGGAFYMLIKSWMGSPINFLAILMFVVAIIKCGERIWALRFASSEQFRRSMVPRPDPGHSYSKFMDDYIAKANEGHNVLLKPIVEEAFVSVDQAHKVVVNDVFPDAVILQHAADFFKIFKRLFADLILSFQDLEISRSFFLKESTTWEGAFRVIEIELGFMYDLLYTKAVLFHTYWGSCLHSISISLTVSTLVSFLMIDKRSYSTMDKSITVVLLVPAVALQVYEIVILLSSDFTLLWITKRKYRLVNLVYKTVYFLQLRLRSCHLVPDMNKRWSNSMPKYNLLSFCLEDNPIKFSGILKFLCIYETLKSHRYKVLHPVSPDLKRLIFQKLVEKSREPLEIENSKKLCAQRGDNALRETGCFETIGWSVEVEFDQSILLWHIATDLCFHIDAKSNTNITENPICKESKSISDYMLYLLVMCPFMLPNGIGQIRFQDTCAEAIQFFKEKRYKLDRDEACRALLEVCTNILPSQVKGDRSKTVLFDGCRLAKAIEGLQWAKERKWEMINGVWIEMLGYGANKCRWRSHARQLAYGGELLSHVWLLMAHLGVTEQFQISKGNARVKLVVS